MIYLEGKFVSDIGPSIEFIGSAHNIRGGLAVIKLDRFSDNFCIFDLLFSIQRGKSNGVE